MVKNISRYYPFKAFSVIIIIIIIQERTGERVRAAPAV
jgi:hypothetical protein